ncbi:hypothetical protein F511_32928 [Dorcoceras hygrometricum]|uniref:Uncharacterized protein n=1 Tax=Dorcoceras hygrometricum TaxID=472368 RepID=A0A2Z7BNI0_9LAMI|nr:hypothetical protein F511_32928 [Dorcoceras hygrometricum]
MAGEGQVNSNEGLRNRGRQSGEIFLSMGTNNPQRRPSLAIYKTLNCCYQQERISTDKTSRSKKGNQRLVPAHKSHTSRIHCSYCQQLDIQSQDQHNAKRYPLLIPAATSKCGVAPLTSAKPAGVFSQNQPPAESPYPIKTTKHPLRATGKLSHVENQQAQLYKSVDACKHTQSKLSTDSRNGITSTNPNDVAQDTQSYIPTAGHPVATSKQRTQYPLLVIQSQPQNAALQLTQTTSLQTRRKHLAKYQTHATMINQQDTISNQSQATGTLTRKHANATTGYKNTLKPPTTDFFKSDPDAAKRLRQHANQQWLITTLGTHPVATIVADSVELCIEFLDFLFGWSHLLLSSIPCIASSFYFCCLLLIYSCSPYWGLTPCPSGAWFVCCLLCFPGHTAGRGGNPAGGAPGGG